MTVGLVLGAGGPLGWAYHPEILDGVREAIGREPANHIVDAARRQTVAAFAGLQPPHRDRP